MKKIRIDLDMFNEPKKFQAWLKEECEFPSYYGCNLDALYDVLSENPKYEFEIVDSKYNGKYQSLLVYTRKDAGCSYKIIEKH